MIHTKTEARESALLEALETAPTAPGADPTVATLCAEVKQLLADADRINDEVQKGIAEGWIDPRSGLAAFYSPTSGAAVMWRVTAAHAHDTSVETTFEAPHRDEEEAARRLLEIVQIGRLIPTAPFGPYTMLERLAAYGYRITTLEPVEHRA